MNAEAMALFGVERALQERAEDRRLDVGPIGAGGFIELFDLRGIEVQRLRVTKKRAVEAVNRAHAEEAPAGVHGLPELLDLGFESLRVRQPALLEEALEGAVF